MRRDCPQSIVGMFGTPIDAADRALFKSAATGFVRCLRAHGYPTYPTPKVDAANLFEGFWQLPFPWARKRFTLAARACVRPLQEYIFRGT